jgi:hypothetical protein
MVLEVVTRGDFSCSQRGDLEQCLSGLLRVLRVQELEHTWTVANPNAEPRNPKEIRILNSEKDEFDGRMFLPWVAVPSRRQKLFSSRLGI